MRRLRPEDWKIQVRSDCMLIAAHVSGPLGDSPHWTRVELSDLPEDFYNLDNLKRIIVSVVDRLNTSGR